MSDRPAISVIIPVYKVEKYIRRCLESVRVQTFRDFEVLIIDDGSPDKSASIALEYCMKDSRFRLFRKKNGGLSDARNFGIERASGEFIGFIDSDDTVHKDYLKVLYEACINNDADMSYCRYCWTLFNRKLTVPDPIALREGVYSTEDALNTMLHDDMLHSFAWNKLYRRKLFTDSGIRYPVMYFEDVATSSRLLMNANRLAVSKRYLYFYDKRSGSIMSTMSTEKIDDLWRSVYVLRNYIQYHGQYGVYQKSIEAMAKKYYLVNVYSILRQHILNMDFQDMKTNLRINTDTLHDVTSDTFRASDTDPDVPEKLHQPVSRKKRQMLKQEKS